MIVIVVMPPIMIVRVVMIVPAIMIVVMRMIVAVVVVMAVIVIVGLSHGCAAECECLKRGVRRSLWGRFVAFQRVKRCPLYQYKTPSTEAGEGAERENRLSGSD